MSKELDIRFSYNSLLSAYRPDIIYLWGNKQFQHWAQEVGYSSVEFSPLWRTTFEIATSSNEDIKQKCHFDSAYASYNPYAKLKSVIGHEEDPMHPKQAFSRDELTYSTPYHSLLAIRKLERAFPNLTVVNETGQNFRQPIIRYPRRGISREKLDGMFQNGRVSGLAWDLNTSVHFLEMALAVGRIKQARLTAPVNIKEVIDRHNFDSELAKNIRLVKESGQDIPILIDIPVGKLIECEAISRANLYLGTANLKYWHNRIIEFIREV